MREYIFPVFILFCISCILAGLITLAIKFQSLPNTYDLAVKGTARLLKIHDCQIRSYKFNTKTFVCKNGIEIQTIFDQEELEKYGFTYAE